MKRTSFSFSAIFLGLSVLCFTGCSDSSAPAKKAEVKQKKPAVPVSGLSGIFQMYQVARTWAPDAQLLKLENGDIPEAKPETGKYGLWRATFVTESKKMKRDYYYAAADSEGGIIKGVRAGSDGMYVRNPQVHPFAIQEVRIDTDKALETALAEVAKDKKMKDWLDQNKDMPVQYVLDWTGTNQKPTWRVVWGPSISQSKFSIFIDANTGKFVKKLQ